ncbi:MAG: SGNH/GDSL hydrolase family protein, partial [Planctomycetaceae bacterium]
PVFVERELPDGRRQMATAENKRQWFNDQHFDEEKPQGTYRVFCVGGSTTYGHPYDDATSFSGWLREFLPAADGSRRWEVINAGGISYASYRVANVVEELARYEPDLIIVLSGHNEFLERRTYASVIGTPEVLRDLFTLIGRLRTYSALRRMVRSLTPNDLTDEEGQILPAEVDAVLDHTIGPESYTRDDALHRHVLEHYRFNLHRIVDIARSADCDVLFITPASNLADCSPFKSEHRSGLGERDRARWQAHVDRAIRARESGEWDAALEALDDAAAIDDRHAELHYVRGQILLEMDRAGDAKAAFRRARDEDVCPLRATTPLCRTVAEVAADRQVPLIDFIRLVAEQSPQG